MSSKNSNVLTVETAVSVCSKGEAPRRESVWENVPLIPNVVRLLKH